MKSDPACRSRPRRTLRRLLALVPLGICFQFGNCNFYLAGSSSLFGGTAGASGLSGRTAGVPNYGQPFVQTLPSPRGGDPP